MNNIKVIICILIILFGLISSIPLSVKWIITVAALFSIPLISLLFRNRTIQNYAIWFGVFLIVQSLISPIVFDRSIKILKPNLKRIVDIQGGVHGISGVQHITTDLKGFRSTKDINYEGKKAGTFRIFAIGGSTTEQIYLDDRKTWTHLLQERLINYFPAKEIEVINTGLSGIRMPHHYNTLREIGKYDPDMVIFLLGFNDWNHQIVSHFFPLIDFSFDKTMLGRTIRRNYESTLNSWIASKKEISAVEKIVEDVYKEKRGSLSRMTVKNYKPEDIPSYYRNYVIKIISFCLENSISCVFMTQPTGYHRDASNEYKKSFWMTPAESKYTLNFESMIHIANLYNRFIINFGHAKGIQVIDLSGEIPGSFEYMYDECHFNINGAQKVSEVIFESLKPIIEDIVEAKDVKIIKEGK